MEIVNIIKAMAKGMDKRLDKMEIVNIIKAMAKGMDKRKEGGLSDTLMIKEVIC